MSALSGIGWYPVLRGAVLSLLVLLLAAIILPSVAVAEEELWLDASVAWDNYTARWEFDTYPEELPSLGDVWRVDMAVAVTVTQISYCDIHFEFETFSTFFRFVNTGYVGHGFVELIPVQGSGAKRSWDVVFGRQQGAYRLWVDGQELVTMDDVPQEQLQRVRVFAGYRGSVNMQGYHARHRSTPASWVEMLMPTAGGDFPPGAMAFRVNWPLAVNESWALQVHVNGLRQDILAQQSGAPVGLAGQWLRHAYDEPMMGVIPWSSLGRTSVFEWNRVDFTLAHIKKLDVGGVWLYYPEYHTTTGWFRLVGSEGEWDGETVVHPGGTDDPYQWGVRPDWPTGDDALNPIAWISYGIDTIVWLISTPIKGIAAGLGQIGQAISSATGSATAMLSGLGGTISVLWSVLPAPLTGVMVAGLALVVAMRVLGR